MSYLALARKWRPRTFSQLIGQEHVNKALINALNLQRLHHAYLFTGTRGVGKTSVARILAKALNCEKGMSAEPCLVCDACIAIEQGRFIDLIEIDGASKTRVEDTRDLLDNVPYAPTSGRFKIYLIDEVHMLSSHSFNALLKTLEEPPAHVKFILATTDPQKLPVTVLSRCLQFHLRHLPVELICQHLQQILKDEKLDYEIKALEILAQAAQGSMRDALSLLDQAITSCNTQLQETDVKLLLGYTQQDYALQLLQSLSLQDPNRLLLINQQICAEGGHFQYVLDELLTYLHQMTVYQNVGDSNPLIKPTSEIIVLAQQFSAEDIQLFYQIALKGCEEIHLAPTLAIGFSMTLLRMLTFRPAPLAHTPPLAFQKINLALVEPPAIDVVTEKEVIETISSNNDQLDRQEAPPQIPLSKIVNTNTIEPITATPPSVIEGEPMPSPTPNAVEETNTISNVNQSVQWANLIPQLKLTGLALNAVENAEFISKEGREITLAVAKGHQSLFTPTARERIETALKNYYKDSVTLILCSERTVQTSPAQQKTQATEQKLRNAEQALLEDPQFQKIKQEFSAELVKNSIVPLKNDL